MNSKEHALARGLVAMVIAVLPVFAVPTGIASVATSSGNSPLARIVATHHDGGPAALSGSLRRPGGARANAITKSRVPPGAPTVLAFAVVALALLGVLRRAVRRTVAEGAVRLPAARAPPLSAA